MKYFGVYGSFILEIFIILLLAVTLQEVGLIIVFCYCIYQIFKTGHHEWLLKSLLYFFVFRFFNPLVLPNSPTLIILSWLTLLIVFIRIFAFPRLSHFFGLKYFVAFILTCLVSSIFKSEYLAISLFKLLSFSIGFICVYLSIKKSIGFPWEEFFISVWICFLVLSLPTLLLPQIGFARNATGFQGITNHPQFFGPFCAMIGGISTVLFSLNKVKPINKVVFFSLCTINLVFVFLSESRTALLLLIFLITIGIIIYLKDSYKRVLRRLPQLFVLFLISLVLILLNFSSLEHRFINFLAKDRSGSTSSLTFDRFSKSRSGLAEIALKNFADNPFLGIGFAAPNHYYDFSVEYLPGTAIPISASMEKGVLVTLLLEEVGVIGFLFFVFFVLSFLVPVLRFNKLYVLFIIGPLILNFGEATFFSTNGQGILLWSLFSLAIFRSINYTYYLENEGNSLAA